MITLKDIAERANVSIRSVSVVLNGKAKEAKISQAVTRKIETIAKELNYRPNALARAIRSKKTFQIGILVSEISNPHTGIVIETVEKELVKNGYKLLLGLTNKNLEVAKTYLNEFSHGVVDGILNLDPEIDTKLFSETHVQVPFINFLRSSPTFNLQFDYVKGVQLALEHLVSLGHKKIGFLSGPKSEVSAAERLHGFQSFFVKERAIKHLLAFGDWTFESGSVNTPLLLKEGCTAIFGANDLMAIGGMKAAQTKGMLIPRDVSIIGFDNSSNALMTEPPMTSVHIPIVEAAALSVKALLTDIANTSRLLESEPNLIIIEPTLILRKSTAGPKQTKIRINSKSQKDSGYFEGESTKL